MGPMVSHGSPRCTLELPVRHIASTSSAFAALDAAGTVRCWGDQSCGGEMATEATEVAEIFGNEARGTLELQMMGKKYRKTIGKW